MVVRSSLLTSPHPRLLCLCSSTNSSLANRKELVCQGVSLANQLLLCPGVTLDFSPSRPPLWVTTLEHSFCLDSFSDPTLTSQLWVSWTCSGRCPVFSVSTFLMSSPWRMEPKFLSDPYARTLLHLHPKACIFLWSLWDTSRAACRLLSPPNCFAKCTSL